VGESHGDENREPGDPLDDADRAMPRVRNDDAERERRVAEARLSSIEAGRRKGGVAGAAMAGAMLALRDIYEGPTKEEIPIEVEASGEPHNLDRDGVDLTVDGVDVSAPALERKAPLSAPKARSSR
jgi:hypothetical protein